MNDKETLEEAANNFMVDDENTVTDRLKPTEAIIFTPEELNEYTEQVIKDALKVAAEKVEIHSDSHHSLSRDFEYAIESGRIWVPSNSITNTFEQIYEKWKI